MRVKVYSVDQKTAAVTFDCECELSEALDGDDYIEATTELTRLGWYWLGGGAAHLSLLTLVRAKALEN